MTVRRLRFRPDASVFRVSGLALAPRPVRKRDSRSNVRKRLGFRVLGLGFRDITPP